MRHIRRGARAAEDMYRHEETAILAMREHIAATSVVYRRAHWLLAPVLTDAARHIAKAAAYTVSLLFIIHNFLHYFQCFSSSYIFMVKVGFINSFFLRHILRSFLCHISYSIH